MQFCPLSLSPYPNQLFTLRWGLNGPLTSKEKARFPFLDLEGFVPPTPDIVEISMA